MSISADAMNAENPSELRRLEAAEREYIRTLYLDHYPAMQRYAYHLGFYGEAVDDWLQETFLVAIRRIDLLKECKNPGAYLMRILRNVIGNALRSMKYAERIAEELCILEAGEGEAHPDESDPAALYRGLIDNEELSLLLRFYLEGWSQKDLARELGIDVEACKKRIQRAKAHLKTAMERDGLR